MEHVYALPIPVVILSFLAIIMIWIFMLKKIQQRYCKNISFIIVVFSALVILYETVLFRAAQEQQIFIIIGKYNNEFYREMIMNVLLYFPFGLSVAYFMGPWSILLGFMLSVAIECWQYFASTGVAQVSDVICNTLGCVIGNIPYFISSIIKIDRIFDKELYIRIIKKIWAMINKNT